VEKQSLSVSLFEISLNILHRNAVKKEILSDINSSTPLNLPFMLEELEDEVKG
jgi:hypothetical protein